MKTLFLIILPIALFGKIIEHSEIACLLEYADNKTLIVCDIDNTLIESAVHMGSAQWRNHIRNKTKLLRFSEEESETVLDKFWLFSQFFVPVRCVDKTAPFVLSTLKQWKIPIIALTAREPIELQHTEKQLKSVGLCFNHDSFPIGTYDLSLQHPSMYYQSIIFCGDNSKGVALAALHVSMNLREKNRLKSMDGENFFLC